MAVNAAARHLPARGTSPQWDNYRGFHRRVLKAKLMTLASMIAVGSLCAVQAATASEWSCMFAKKTGKESLTERYCNQMESPPSKFSRFLVGKSEAKHDLPDVGSSERFQNPGQDAFLDPSRVRTGKGG
jgi:hypothetical protein